MGIFNSSNGLLFGVAGADGPPISPLSTIMPSMPSTCTCGTVASSASPSPISSSATMLSTTFRLFACCRLSLIVSAISPNDFPRLDSPAPMPLPCGMGGGELCNCRPLAVTCGTRGRGCCCNAAIGGSRLTTTAILYYLIHKEFNDTFNCRLVFYKISNALTIFAICIMQPFWRFRF